MADVLDQYKQLVEQLPGYEPRPMQETMVEKITAAMDTLNTVVIEAGTGSGKSFGYLIPALHSGKRPIVISTGFEKGQTVVQLVTKPKTSFIQKPFFMSDLKKAILAAMNG